ncbi:MAG: glutamate--tRNA ligase [Candidatus Pacebacteria bacterium]|nr:glutamate--tRNA ligase [Candidatus Paceibacterota bacterium]
MNKKVRLRFAPSPTGFLHIGGLRTALFAYIIAKSQAGKIILRIEDTDQAREVEGAADKLVEILSWAGINFDESPQLGGSFGPYIQTQRLDIYKQHAQTLLDSGKAYRCFCSTERLQALREEQQKNKQAPRYDNHCRGLSLEESNQKAEAGESFVIRQKMPLEGVVEAVDELRGKIVFEAKNLDDHVLIKSDGIPTYQFASVVDDHLMEISHVTRGEEWIPSFPKNILLYQAFSWEAPKFIHLPLILNKEGGKLSKRQNDVAVEDYREQGYLPKALLNFCLLLGWHPKDDKEILDLKEVLEKFKIKDMQVSPAVFDRDKLDFFNGYYLRQLNEDEFAKEALPFLSDLIEIQADKNFKIKNTQKQISYEQVKKILNLEQSRIKKLSELPELVHNFFIEDLDYDKDLLIWKSLSFAEIKDNLLELKALLETVDNDNWNKGHLENLIITYLKDKEAKLGDYLWPFRVALTGRKNSPGPFESAEALGREESLKRTDKALTKL